MKSTLKRPALNMREVAKHAGVSSATVSRVLSGSNSVRPETADHVRRIIKELNFIPNPIATTLKYGRSNTYGLIIPDLTNPYFHEFLRNFEEALVESDQELLLASTESGEHKLVSSVRRMLMRHVDGVVLMGSEYDTRVIEPLISHRIPIVTLDRRRTEEGVSDVTIDFENAYKQAVQHLKDLGHQHIGYIGGSSGIATSEFRLQAFQQAIESSDLPYNPRYVRTGDYRVSGGDAAIRSLLKEPAWPTAVITANDLTAFGVLRALHACGIDVPSQISVVGLDGITLSDAIYPSLTTIQIPSREMARTCLKALEYTKMNLNRRGIQLSVRGTLVVRDSTTVAPYNTLREVSR